MATSLAAEPVPLLTDADGVIRIGSTRVQLETVVIAFESGATAEEIAQDFPSIELSDIYAVLAWCLRHPEEVKQYMDQRRVWADEMRHRVLGLGATTGPSAGGARKGSIRERLRARRS